MSLFQKKDLTVNKTDVIKEYNNMTDEDLLKEVQNKIRTIRTNRNLKINFILLVGNSPLTRKQSILFLTKFKTNSQIIGYLFRHLIRCAHFYGVPRAVIKRYDDSKKLFDLYNDRLNRFGASKNHTEHKSALEKEGRFLMNCTLEMIDRSKTRKFKLNTLMDKMAEKVDK